MKIYAVSDGPPSLAVRMALKALDIAHEHIPVDYGKGEHMTEDYAKVSRNSRKSSIELFKTSLIIFVDEPPKGDSSLGGRWVLLERKQCHPPVFVREVCPG